MSAYLYVLHERRAPRVRLVAAHEPFTGVKEIGDRFYDIPKSRACIAPTFAQAQRMRLVLSEALLQGYNKASYAQEETLPDAHVEQGLAELIQQFPNTSTVQDILNLAAPKTNPLIGALPDSELREVAIARGAQVEEGIPFVGRVYLPLSRATKTQVSPEQNAFMRAIADLRERCTFLALMGHAEGSESFVHDRRRCLVGVYPKGAATTKTLVALHGINEEKLEPASLWQKHQISKVCRIGRFHVREANEHGQVLFELEFKDPADGEAYLAYPKYPTPQSSWLRLPADEGWYLQASASAAAHDLLQLPLGIPGWDVPLMSDAYERLHVAVASQVKPKRAARKVTTSRVGVPRARSVEQSTVAV